MNDQKLENSGTDAAMVDRLTAMEALLVSQQAEITELKRQLKPECNSDALPACASVTAPEIARSGPSSSKSSARVSSRRMMLKGCAVAAGAAMAGAVVAPKSAVAADGGNLIIGGNNTSAGGNTRLNGTGAGAYSGQNIFTVSDQATSSTYEAAIGAYAQGDRVYNGLYAFSDRRLDSDTSTGHAIVARSTFGSRSNILLTSSGSAPSSDSYAHVRGSLRHALGGDLWFCTNSGTPGVWKKLTGPASSGALHAISPARVYDSRLSGGPLATGSERVVSVANRIDPFSGAITAFNVVPDGATAVHFNIAITQTSGGGFILIAPGDATSITAATINWGSNGLTLSNASLSTLDDSRQLKALSGGNGRTHFIIDITGYTI